MNTAIGGHYSEDEDKAAFMGNIHELADYAAERGVEISLEVHGDIMATGQISIPLMEEIGRANVGINYDTANCVFYGGVEPWMTSPGRALPQAHSPEGQGRRQVWDFPAVGEGHVNFWGLLKILRKGYRRRSASRSSSRAAVAAGGRGASLDEGLLRDLERLGLT